MKVDRVRVIRETVM